MCLLFVQTLLAFLGQSWLLRFLQEWHGLRFLQGLSGISQLEPAEGIFSLHVASLISLVLLVYIGLIILLVAALLLWLLALRLPAFVVGDRKAGPPLDAALSALLFQIGLWGLTFQSFSVLILDKFPEKLFTSQSYVMGRLTHSVLWNLILAVLVGGAGLLAWLHLSGWACWWHYCANNRAARANDAPRLLLSRWVVFALVVAAALSCAAAPFMGSYFKEWVDGWGISAGQLAGYIALGLTVVGYVAKEGLRAALHVVMDVISHFYRLHLLPGWNEPPMAELVETFTIQQRIEHRFKSVVREVFRLIEVGRVRQLTFVTHSQGTVIALDVLWQRAAHQLLKEQHDVQQVNLITMGSPITHLYQRYFPERYPELFLNGHLNQKGWGATLTETVDRWVNLYRVDDFVGTFITGGEVAVAHGPNRPFPLNQFLDVGGHTDYWCADDVLARLRPYLPG
jgi:hypothetical protein